MKFLKLLLFGLVFLVTLTQIFNYPGSSFFQSFFQSETKSQYPPLLSLLLDTIKQVFPLSGESYFYGERVWIASKFIVYGTYLLIFLLLVRFGKNTFNLVDTALLYFGSFAILLTSVSLHFFEILSAPFILLALIAAKTKSKFAIAILMAGVLFSWHTIIFLPAFVIYFWRSKKLYAVSLLSLLLLLLLPNTFKNTEVFNLNWLLSYPYQIYIKQQTAIMFPFLSSASVVLGIGSFITILFWFRRRIVKSYLIWVLPLIFLVLGKPSFFQAGLFIAIYLKLGELIAKYDFSSFLKFCLAICLSYILFSFTNPLTIGFLAIPVLISLLLHFNLNNQFSFTTLISMNIVVFTNAFLRLGSAGVTPVRGEYFAFSIIPVAIFSLFYYLYLLLRLLGIKYEFSKLKFLVILFMLLFNLAILTANGSSDRVAWSDYAKAASVESNPFAAHALASIDQRYPPLSTVIMGTFVNTWKATLGFRNYPNVETSPDYAQSVKVSVLVFYLITVFLLYKISRVNLFVIVTTFSIVLQTQGLGDVNIYLIPTLIAAIFLLGQKKLLLSGLLMGITLSIKWQPIILLPLFAAAIFDREKFIASIPKAIRFGVGLIFVPIVSWMLVLAQPGGIDSFYRATEYLIQGAPKLSGQALNLNWIVTYVLHSIDYNSKIESLAHLDGLNRQIDSILAPTIFQGYFFIIAVALIVLHYFLRQKNSIHNFVSGCFMIFFSHQMLNKSAYEKHLFYSVVFLLVFYLLRPTKEKRILLILFDLMTVVNLIFFYGFTGPKDVNRMFLGFDLTVLFSIYYVFIYFYVFYKYFRTSGRLM